MYTENERALIWVSLFDFITLVKKQKLVSLYSEPSKLYKNFELDKQKIVELVGEENYNSILVLKNEMILNNHIAQMEKENIKIVTLYSPSYPALLKNTTMPPLVLYCKGDIDLLKTDCLAVVGTRNCTRYGIDVTQKFTETLARNNLTIVSGLALGIDTCAHETCLNNNGKTIAVLAGGFHQIYPQSNYNLAQRIVENGLLISEYKPNEEANRYNFPIRNRIIAGLSKGVLITEAGEKSGAMYTKEYALEYGRDLFVVPGNITNVRSSGCNQILKSLQGAMVTEPQDILSTYGMEEVNSISKVAIQTTMDEQIVISLFKGDELHYDEILAKTKFEAKRLNTLLTTMQIRGLIKKLAGNYFALN